VKEAKKGVEELLFKAWKDEKDPAKRENLHSELRVLDKLTFRLIKSIRGINNG
jgi:hypothetical protein